MGPFVDIKDFEGRYKVDHWGNVLSCSRKIYSTITEKQTGSVKDTLMKTILKGTPYPKVALSKNGKMKFYSLHRLLASHFLKNEKGLKVVNHLDGNKTNYSLENLEWTTSGDNQRHAYNTGLMRKKKGENNGRASFSNTQVINIRKDFELGMCIKDLVKKYKSYVGTIHGIVTNRTWSHI